jgi:hypothetical protein
MFLRIHIKELNVSTKFGKNHSDSLISSQTRTIPISISPGWFLPSFPLKNGVRIQDGSKNSNFQRNLKIPLFLHSINACIKTTKQFILLNISFLFRFQSDDYSFSNFSNSLIYTFFLFSERLRPIFFCSSIKYTNMMMQILGFFFQKWITW